MFWSDSKWNKGKKANWASIPEVRPAFGAEGSLWIGQTENELEQNFLSDFEASRSMLKDSPLRRADTHQTMWRRRKKKSLVTLFSDYVGPRGCVMFSGAHSATPPQSLDFNAPATLLWTPSAGSEGRGGTTDVAWTPRPQPLTPRCGEEMRSQKRRIQGRVPASGWNKASDVFFFFFIIIPSSEGRRGGGAVIQRNLDSGHSSASRSPFSKQRGAFFTNQETEIGK